MFSFCNFLFAFYLILYPDNVPTSVDQKAYRRKTTGDVTALYRPVAIVIMADQ